jgi:hypothetical protein
MVDRADESQRVHDAVERLARRLERLVSQRAASALLPAAAGLAITGGFAIGAAIDAATGFAFAVVGPATAGVAIDRVHEVVAGEFLQG